jgi:hypothetical protein
LRFDTLRRNNAQGGTTMNLSMKDRVAVVTGGSKGIGIAVARRFAESGAKVAILARGAADLKTARETLARDGLAVRDYVCDVSKAADITRTHNQIVADFGKIDVLVNNAGTSRAMAFENISDEAWQEDLDLKLFAAIRFSRLVWGGMKQRKWGRIINRRRVFVCPVMSRRQHFDQIAGATTSGWRRCPFQCRKRTWHSGATRSAKCRFETRAPQQTAYLFDHDIGLKLHRVGN